jgi:putative ABC transport system permease protein
VRSLPGVVSAAAISQLPLRDPYNNVGIYAASAPPVSPAEGGDGYQRVVLPGYFETMGIPLLAGRDIQPTDSAESRRVVVVSRTLARSLFPGRNPLGELVVIDRAAEATWEVVGVVGDVRQSGLREEPDSRGTFYRAHGQQPLPRMRLAIRTAGDPKGILPPLRRLLRDLDSRVPLSGPRTMADVIARSTVSESAQSVCLTTFSALALTLAAPERLSTAILAHGVIDTFGAVGLYLGWDVSEVPRALSWPRVFAEKTARTRPGAQR